MPKVTWLGDVDNPGTTENDACCSWGDYTFPVVVPVEVDDAHILGKARGNRFFRVEPVAEPASGRVDYDTFLDQPLQVQQPAPKRSHKKKAVSDADH